MSLTSTVKGLFSSPGKQLEQKALSLKAEINDISVKLNDAFAAAKAEYQSEALLREAFKEQTQLLDEMANAAGGMIWRKDAEGKYLFANHLHCVKFFGLSACDDYLGYTDNELIERYVARAGVRHTLRNLCSLSDEYTKQAGIKCRFMEFGFIGDQAIVLNVIKTPVYHNGVFTGTVGFAFDLSSKCNTWLERIVEMEKSGEATKLADGLYVVANTEEVCGAAFAAALAQK